MGTTDTGGNGSWLVVVGSSAGGIEALSALLGSIPEPFGASIVIAQHLQPSRDSHLSEILAPRSRIPVQTVSGREHLQPGVAYLVPPDRHVSITDHTVTVEPAGQEHPAPSIDRLLRSAADVFGDQLIAVILSGMGTDGAAGAAEVKTQGGTVIIQNPETAGHAGMPRALPPNIVDFIADADRIGELLGELVSAPMDSAPDDERLLRVFLDEIRERTGIDFSAYKSPTIQRRLQRRMVATGNPRLRDYVRFVHKHPEEYSRLTSAFLIKVTQFFRDADLFEHLRDLMLPSLIDDARSRQAELRLWSGGCATGEEAYSLAMLVADALGTESTGVRIFATDLDEDAIAFARRGIYPPSSLANVPDELIGRHFISVGADFEVNKAIRSMVVFGQHDLAQRAPFPRIDLAVCRNVLIYFTPELQKRALQLFAFSLREGGYLVLGKAESTTPLAEHFILEHPRLRIYRRAGERVVLPPGRLREGVAVAPARPTPREVWPTSLQGPVAGATRTAEVERPEGVLLALPLGVVVVDDQYDVGFLNAAARRLLGIHGAGVGHDFVHLAHALPSEDLRQGLDSALRGETTAITLPLDDSATDVERTAVRLTFQPRRRPEGGRVLSVIVAITDATADTRAADDAALDSQRLREDLDRTRDRGIRLDRSNRELLAANEELTNTNTMLETANEELLLANEEVQAATEEVETLNEELQATNEELETLNEELQATVEELNTTNDDLQARSLELQETAASLHEERARAETEATRLALLLDGMAEAVLAVDATGEPVAVNGAYEQLFGDPAKPLQPEDETGAPLPPDDWPQVRAARGETFTSSFTARATDGTRLWLEAVSRGSPTADGGVIVFRDITDRSLRLLQERFMAAAGHELRTPVAALHGFLQLVERQLHDDPEGAAAYLERSITETRRLGELVTRLFDVALVQHGRLALTHESLDLVATVRDAIDTARVLYPEVEFQMISTPRSVRITADALRLQQVLVNVLSNAAVHGSAAGGRVTIEVSRVDGEARVGIVDEGPGIPRSIIDAEFRPFTRGEPTGDGLGLGLYLAHEIVEAHGGRIALSSGQGDGANARVVIALPLRGRRAKTTAHPA